MSEISISKVKNGLRNEAIKVKNPIVPPEHPEHLFKLHTIAAFVGPRGSGKTNACALLAKEYRDHHTFTDIFIISPTYESNPCMFCLHVPPGNIYKDAKRGQIAILDIQQRIEEKGIEWENFQGYKACYQRYLHNKHTLSDEMVLERNNYEAPPHMKKPSFLVIVDDMSCTDMYSTSNDNPLNNLVLRHRHIGKLGLSLFFLVQNFKHGMAKFMRQNMQQFFIWPVNDRELVEDIWKEFANTCTFQQFLEMYALATKEPHSFFVVDPFQEDPTKRFRKNFDTYLQIPFTSASQQLLQDVSKKRPLPSSELTETKKVKKI